MKRETVVLLNVTMALVLVGVLMVYSAGTVQTYRTDEPTMGHHFGFLIGQLIRVAIGLAGLFIAANFDYHYFQKRSILGILIAVMLTLLVLVLIFADVRLGGRRWLSLYGFSVQPSDLARIVLIVYLAVKLSENQEQLRSLFKGVLPPIGVAGLFLGLIMLQRDIGTPVVLGAVALGMLLMAGAKLWHLGMLTGLFVVPVLTYIHLNPHAQERIYSFRDPWKYRLGEGYQLIQSLWAFARGGVMGQGPGAGQQKLAYLPEAHSDFIFAVWAEEMGLVGTVGVVLLFGLFVIMGLRIAACAPDLLGALLAAGLTTMIGLQALLCMGVTTGMLPTKGMTLPFISAGGTALIVNLTMVGMLINVAMQAEEHVPKRSMAKAH